MYLHTSKNEKSLFTRIISLIMLFGFFLLFAVSAQADSESKATIKALKSCSKTYFSCQTVCRNKKVPKEMLTCINKVCAKEYNVCRATAINVRKR